MNRHGCSSESAGNHPNAQEGVRPKGASHIPPFQTVRKTGTTDQPHRFPDAATPLLE